MSFPRVTFSTVPKKSQSLGFFASSNRTFFVSPEVPTLKEIALNELCNQLNYSVEKIEEFINNHPGEGLYNDLPFILAKTKKLHQYVVDNKVDEVDELLTNNFKIILPLLKLQGILITPAKGLKSYVIVEGTALRIALGAEAVGKDGCDLCLMTASSRPVDTNFKKISLYSNGPMNPFIYFINGQKWTISRGEDDINGEKLSGVHFDKLKKMFKNPYFYNKNLNLSHPALNEAQRDAYVALLKITSQRNHTKRENEEGLVEVLLRHIKRALSDEEGEREIIKQVLEQFTEKSRIDAEKRHTEDLKALYKVRDAIAKSLCDSDQKVVAALLEFKTYLEPKDIIRAGKHWNARLLYAALELSYRKYFWDGRKNTLFYNQVIGYIQRFAPMNYKHHLAQGLEEIEAGKKSNHSMRCTDNSYFYLMESSTSGIGFDSWVDGSVGVMRSKWAGVIGNDMVIFQNYMLAKTSILQKLMPNSDDYSQTQNPKMQCMIL